MDDEIMKTSDLLATLQNRPLDRLDKENDFIDLANRAIAIKNFIKNILLKEDAKSRFCYDISIIGIYGAWGSGKSSVVNEVHQTFIEDTEAKCKTLIFPAWEYENSSDIALSFLDFLIDHANYSGRKTKQILKNSKEVLIGAVEGVSINLPMGIGFNPEKIIKRVEKINQNSGEKSYHKKKKKLLEDYNKIVEDILASETNNKKGIYKKLVVFIDDLDRCEPENILKLISTLKLFFSNSMANKTAYFIAVDENAVTEALKCKYSNEVKAEEYMEKIIDYSFSLPDFYSISKITRRTFEYISKSTYGNLATTILSDLNITNPRKVKKILTKYFLLINHENSNSQYFPPLLKSRDCQKKEHNQFEFAFFFFALILKEFFPFQYIHFKELPRRGEILDNVLNNNSGRSGTANFILRNYRDQNNGLAFSSIIEELRKRKGDIQKNSQSPVAKKYSSTTFELSLILPFLPTDYLPDLNKKSKEYPADNNELREFLTLYEGKTTYNKFIEFCWVIVRNHESFLDLSDDVDMDNHVYLFENIFNFLDTHA